MSHRNWMFPLVTYFFVLFFFETEFGSIQKNSGLNPWNFQFWGYPRLGPRPKLASPKTGGWIRQCRPTPIDVFIILHLCKSVQPLCGY